MKFLIGVDGGGSGTRAVLADSRGRLLGRGSAGPSGLALGAARAWTEIRLAIDAAADQAGRSWRPAEAALGAGLAGLNHPDWRLAFLRADPGFFRVEIDTDAGIALRAAHGGAPGLLVAAGTGSVAEVLLADGGRRSTGGWGFPVGDEGSGAWLGLAAMRHAQCALDGRAQAGALALAICQACGTDRDTLLAWSLAAGQAAYAGLAPLVFACADQDPVADSLLNQAAQALETMARALDPQSQLPVRFSGSVATRLCGRCSPDLRRRLRGGESEPTLGALAMIQSAVECEG